MLIWVLWWVLNLWKQTHINYLIPVVSLSAETRTFALPARRVCVLDFIHTYTYQDLNNFFRRNCSQPGDWVPTSSKLWCRSIGIHTQKHPTGMMSAIQLPVGRQGHSTSCRFEQQSRAIFYDDLSLRLVTAGSLMYVAWGKDWKRCWQMLKVQDAVVGLYCTGSCSVQ